MQLSIVLLAFAAVVSATPTKRQAKAANIFGEFTFNDISIAGGTAGTAKEDALAKLAAIPTDLTTLTNEDINLLSDINKIVTAAQKQTYAQAIIAATPGEDVLALQVSPPCLFLGRFRMAGSN